MSIPEPPQIREHPPTSAPSPDWQHDYLAAKRRFDQALDDVVEALDRSDGRIEFLTVSRTFITHQVRRVFQKGITDVSPILTPPIIDLAKARAARTLHRPDGAA